MGRSRSNKKKVNNKNKSNTLKINSSLIKNYKSYLEINDIFISYEIEDRLKYLSKRANEPMKLAVSGLFSSGKSTFLNAMLSDDILPSGNLPITSKITYLKYGDEAQLKLTYNDGREELASVDSIAKYVDQQSAEQIKSINHITLYYPKEILKNIVFVDTPGFNSPNKMDDETTEDILENVDGILWLTMISNAGKKSEIDILEKYFKQYNQKSICIVNHKDEIDDDDEVNEFIEELKDDNNFSKYFADIIPISAIQALESRQKDQDKLMLKLVKDFSDSIEEKLISHIENETILEAYQSVMKDDLVEFIREHNQIKKSDKNKNTALFQESNIQNVFSYIENKIMPQASSTLSFSLHKEMSSINNEISEHYKYLIGSLHELELILGQFNEYQKIEMNNLVNNANMHIRKIDKNIDNLSEEMANILFNSFDIHVKDEFVSDGERTFWSDTPTGDWIRYNIYNFNEEKANELFKEDNSSFMNTKKRLGTSLDKLYEIIDEDISNIESKFEKDIGTWKEKYKIIQEYSPENLDLMEIAFESFEIFGNDFENQVIYFRNSMMSAIQYIYDSLCDADNVENAGYSSASRFNGSEEKPTYDNMFKNINIVLNTDFAKSYLDGDNSFLLREVTNVKKILSEISNNKLEMVKHVNKQWINKDRSINEYMEQLEKRK